MVSSAYLGAFPATFIARGIIDWLPVDKVPKILQEILATASHNPQPTSLQGAQVFHITNPNVQSWGEFATSVVSLFSPTKMRLVEFTEWLALLRESVVATAKAGRGGAGVERNPAALLLDFLSGIAGEAQGPRVLTHERAKKASRELERVGRINEDWLRNWMGQWGLLKTE